MEARPKAIRASHAQDNEDKYDLSPKN